jgi:hypothetical protein
MPDHLDSQLQISDVMMEVSIMERFAAERGICSLLEYGVQPGGFRLVMPLYRCDLAEWRERLPTAVPAVLPLQRLFINIFQQVRTSPRHLHPSAAAPLPHHLPAGARPGWRWKLPRRTRSTRSACPRHSTAGHLWTSWTLWQLTMHMVCADRGRCGGAAGLQCSAL